MGVGWVGGWRFNGIKFKGYVGKGWVVSLIVQQFRHRKINYNNEEEKIPRACKPLSMNGFTVYLIWDC